MLHHLVFVQPCIVKLMFLTQVVLYGHTQILPTSIKHRITSQHPLLFRDVVIAESSSMFEHPLEDGTMNSSKSCNAVGKSICLKKFRYVTRNSVCLFLVCVIIVVGCFLDVVFLHQFACFIDGDFTLNIPTGGILQIF